MSKTNNDPKWHNNIKPKFDKNNPVYNLKQGLEMLRKTYQMKLTETLKLQKEQQHRDKKNARSN